MSGPPSESVAGHPEIIVVLGGGMFPDGTPAPATLARGRAAADLARAHPEAAIICSGSHGVGRKPRRSEAASMADLIGVASAPAPDDAERAKHERRFLLQTREFLAGIAPGEVSRINAKLRERH